MTGHMLGAAGGVEAVDHARSPSRAACCRRPSTTTTPDPECDLDYVPEPAREVRVDAVAVATPSGSAGTNAVLAFKPLQAR